MDATLMTWQDVLADKSLQDLPYKIELSSEGQIIMSPAGVPHGRMQMKIAAELMLRSGGETIGECGIQTADGVRSPDVMWASDAYLARGLADPLQSAPEICVEIVSPSNSKVEMQRKVALYLQAGAHEVWIVGIDGSRVVHRQAP